MNKIEKAARAIAAEKMMLVKDHFGVYLPNDLWKQCISSAVRSMAATGELKISFVDRSGGMVEAVAIISELPGPADCHAMGMGREEAIKNLLSFIIMRMRENI